MGVPHRIDEENKLDDEEIENYVSLNESIKEIQDGSYPRIILIDGANLIHSALCTGKTIFDIKVCTHKLNAIATLVIVQKLLSAGFEVIVLMKKFFEDQDNSDNAFIFNELKQLEIVRFLDDSVDDDSRLLRSAEFYGGAVVSRDRFRQTYYTKYVEGKSRSISFRFFKSKVDINDYYMPENKMDMFTDLKFIKFERAYANPRDADFEKVKRFYNQYRTSGYHEQTLARVNLLSEFLQFEFCKTMHVKPPILPYFNTKLDCPIKFSDFKQHYLRYQRNQGRNAYDS